MIRKLKSGQYRLYSRKLDPATKKRRNLGTFDTREAAQKHERAVQSFKRRGLTQPPSAASAANQRRSASRRSRLSALHTSRLL